MDDFIFYSIVIGGLLYFAVFVWAVAEAERLGRTWWLSSLLTLGPLALIAWIVYGRRQE